MGDMSIKKAIELIKKSVPDAKKGLPEEVFLLLTELTPMVNVDLLIKDEKGRTLLSWRNDKDCGRGWHIPGGIIRFKEGMIERVNKVAHTEIRSKIQFEPKPIGIQEIMINPKVRGHFISFLFKCYLPSSFKPNNKGLKKGDAGYLLWHEKCPENLIETHKVYKPYISRS